MTGIEFKRRTMELPDDCEVQIESRVKTGYDEGDIYVLNPEKFTRESNPRHRFETGSVEVYRLTTNGWKAAGGW